MNNAAEMGAIIKKERKILGDNLDDLAQKIGISRQTLAKWEAGQGNGPTVNDLLRMCELFRCDFGYLVGEYSCKTREATDIQALTGLTESAILKLQKMSPEDPHQIVSKLIEHPNFVRMIDYIDMAIDSAQMYSAQAQKEYERFRQVLLKQAQDPHTPTGKRLTDLLLATESVAELDSVVNILAESALNSIVLNREDAKKFYTAEAQKELNRIVEEIK